MKLGQQLAGGGRESATPEKAAGKVAIHASPGDLLVPQAVIQSAPPQVQQAVLAAFKTAGLDPVHYLVPGAKGKIPQQPAQQQPQQAPQGQPEE